MIPIFDNIHAEVTACFVLVATLSACSPGKEMPGGGNAVASVVDELMISAVDNGPLKFEDSLAALEVGLRENLIHSGIPDGMQMARELRLLLGASRSPDVKLVLRLTMKPTLREFLQTYATRWDTAVLLEGNTILVIERWDADRFAHEVAIVSKAEPPVQEGSLPAKAPPK